MYLSFFWQLRTPKTHRKTALAPKILAKVSSGFLRVSAIFLGVSASLRGRKINIRFLMLQSFEACWLCRWCWKPTPLFSNESLLGKSSGFTGYMDRLQLVPLYRNWCSHGCNNPTMFLIICVLAMSWQKCSENAWFDVSFILMRIMFFFFLRQNIMEIGVYHF